MSEAALFKSQLGSAWSRVDPDIQTRFDADPIPGQPIFYDGVMTKISCSFLGMLLARLSALFAPGALCAYNGDNVRAEIEVYKQPGSSDIHKTRSYYFANKPTYVFKSNMHLAANGDLLEYVSKHLGMRIKVQEKNGALFFTDRGYFIELGGHRFGLPRLFSPGDVELTHANRGPNQFQIFIDISHPLFGRMYHQEGIFTRRPV